MTKKEARQQIERYKDETNYFHGAISMESMEHMFRHNFMFGMAETKVIMAALVLAGADFWEERGYEEGIGEMQDDYPEG